MEISCGMLASASLIGLVAPRYWPTRSQASQVRPKPPPSTIAGKQLPPPDPKFVRVIKEKASDSKAWRAPRGPRGCLPT